MERVTKIILLAALAVSIPSVSQAVPEPGLAPTKWQLDFEFHDPARITLNLPGQSNPTTFWYLLYTVTNNTDQEVEFYPSFSLVTDTLHVVEGGADIHPMAAKAIAERHRKQYPFFVRPVQVAGSLQQGSDHRKTSAVIFRDFDPNAGSFTIYVSGLSSEITRLRNPAFNDQKVESEENPLFFILRKTLAIVYNLPGDPQTRSRAIPQRVSREWVMR